MRKNIMAGILLGTIVSGIILNLDIVNKGGQNRMLLYSTDISVNGDFDDYFDFAVLCRLNSNRNLTPKIPLNYTQVIW